MARKQTPAEKAANRNALARSKANAESARLLPSDAADDTEGGPTDPLSANYRRPEAGGPRVSIPARKIPR